MPIKIDCPRCKKPLSVPSKKAGGYANCPQCDGRFWVPQETPAGKATTPAVAESPPMPAAPSDPTSPPGPSSPPMGPSPASMRSTARVSSPQDVSPPAPTPSSPASGRKVARFISAEAAQSPLKAAEDGQLPELQLQEGDKKKEEKEEKGSTVNPLVLFGVLAMSVVFSIIAVLYEPGSAGDSNTRAKQAARLAIEGNYFGEMGGKDPLKPYQINLRKAQRAHTQGDFKSQRELYRSVLRLLRSERPEHAGGLTGSRGRDQQLEEHISVLLSNR